MAAVAPLPSFEEILEKNPQVKREDIEYLQRWMSKQPHLPRAPDELLVTFLHTKYYSRELAKKSIENYFTIRTHIPEIFRNRDPLTEEAKKQLTAYEAGRLLKKDKDGYTVWLCRLATTDPSRINFDLSLKIAMMNLDQSIQEDPTCAGYVVVIDCTGVTMGHMAVISLNSVKRMLKYLQEGYNLHLKRLHLINASPVVDYFMQMVKPFLGKELMSLIHIHAGPLDELYKFVPQEILPTYYGGKLGNMAEIHDYMARTLEKYRDWFLANELFVDETKRQGKSKNADDIFGIDGSFKKLDID